MKPTTVTVATMTAAVGLCALGLLTVVELPTLTGWKLALLATEFGHWIAPLALVPAAVSGWSARRGYTRAASILTATVALAAFTLLMSPAWRAHALARTLGASLDIAELYSLGESFAVETETHTFVHESNYSLALTVSLPAYLADTNRPRTAIILIHGGGWDGGSRDELPGFTHWLASTGCVVFAIDYRLAPQWRWPAPRDDLRAAILWVRDHHVEFEINPERIVLFGRSAGAQIALATAYDTESPRVQGVIAFYGPADMHFAYEHGREDDVLRSPGLLRAYLGGPPSACGAAYDAASPILHVRHDIPPTLLVHGGLDSLVWHRQSERLAARIAEAGAPIEFVSLPWATHAFEYNLHGPSSQIARARVKSIFPLWRPSGMPLTLEVTPIRRSEGFPARSQDGLRGFDACL